MAKKCAKTVAAKTAPKTSAATTKQSKTTVKTKKVTFRLEEDYGKKIYLAGTFNDWDSKAKQMTFKKKDNAYSTILTLAPGTYQYKFVIDGVWCVDPANQEWMQNEHGTLNSVVHV